MAKMSLEDLRKLRDQRKSELQKREIEGKEIQVIIGMGTCGIAAGAKETLDSFLLSIDEAKLASDVMVRQTGCMGLCHSEPTVELVVPGMPTVIYGNVDGETAKEIVKKHLIGRQLVNKLIIDRPAADIVG